MITTQSLIAFGLLSFVAAFVQTLTGFAFGLLLVGAVALTALMSLQDVAIIVSILTIVNAALVLFRGWRNIAARPLLMSVLGSIPMVVVGYVLLDQLAENYLNILRVTLGIIIIISSFLLIKRAQQLRNVGRDRRGYVWLVLYSWTATGLSVLPSAIGTSCYSGNACGSVCRRFIVSPYTCWREW